VICRLCLHNESAPMNPASTKGAAKANRFYA
jgi:hypothetical protein